jgi:hypothetical protein
MTEEKAVVAWSVSGLPPTYTERRWRAEVPASLRTSFDAALARAKFFDRPDATDATTQDARDAGTYRITVTIGARKRTIAFSDAGTTQDLADLRNWLQENLAAVATRE